ncbi:MAG: hypothetical protein HY055_05860 [Magnetospirillum sp.]|nr:hypothetical protein [Magnetospirillum sp.]
MAANHQELRSDHLELRSDHQELRSELTRTAPPTEAEAEALPVKGLPRPLPGEAVRITPPLPSAYFIVGCGRSGTTSLVRILDKAANGICRSEPGPILGLESRLLREGRLDQPFAALTRTIAPRIADTLDQGLIYGEKNLTLPPFIPHLHALFRCRFVHVIRDGRDVVSSWLDWHDQVYGNIYRECREPGHLSPRAREWVATYPAAEDEYDTSRPRPLPNDPWHDLWPGMRRLEMLAWHWVRTNEDIIAGLDRLAPDHWRALDYSHVDTSRIMELIAFLGLTGLDAATVEAMLTAKINRLEEMAPDCVRFPAWGDWSETDKVAFDAIAHPTMRRLGYYPPGQGRYRPRDLVTAWPGDDAGSTGDLEWLRRHIEGARPQSIRQAGGSAARSLFADAGVETVAADQWIEQSRPPVSLALARSDVWSRLWDIESGLDRLMAESRDALFVSFRDSGLTEHRHRRDSGTGLYDNDVSLIAIRRQLAEGRWQIAHCAVHQGLTVLLARPGILPDRGGDR